MLDILISVIYQLHFVRVKSGMNGMQKKSVKWYCDNGVFVARKSEEKAMQ